MAGRVETVGGNQKNNHITCPGLENLDVIWHKSRFRTGRIGRLAPVGGRLALNRRIDNKKTVIVEVKAWQEHRNNKNASIDWHFNTKDARVKLKRLYPSIIT